MILGFTHKTDGRAGVVSAVSYDGTNGHELAKLASDATGAEATAVVEANRLVVVPLDATPIIVKKGEWLVDYHRSGDHVRLDVVPYQWVVNWLDPLPCEPRKADPERVHGHEGSEVDDALEIYYYEARDRYEIRSDGCFQTGGSLTDMLVIDFQCGPVKESGVNGVTNEALLAILIHRLGRLNRPPYACRENQLAIANLEAARNFLLQRTRERHRRDVEGTSQP